MGDDPLAACQRLSRDLLVTESPQNYCTEMVTVKRQLEKPQKEAQWRLIDKVELQAAVGHPQGVVKWGNTLFLTAVNPVLKPRPSASGQVSPAPEKGSGALYQFSLLDGALVHSITLGDAWKTHPGGFDVDPRRGELIIPVAVYAPQTATDIVAIDMETLEVRNLFHVADHIGALGVDWVHQRYYGIQWGERWYAWNRNGRTVAQGTVPQSWGCQDLQWISSGKFFCTAHQSHPVISSETFPLFDPKTYVDRFEILLLRARASTGVLGKLDHLTLAPNVAIQGNSLKTAAQQGAHIGLDHQERLTIYSVPLDSGRTSTTLYMYQYAVPEQQ